MKTCTKCKMEKPANTEYFCKKKRLKDGLSYTCKDCDREYRKQERAKNKKKIFIYDDKKVKECNKCKMEKPATPDYFHRDKKLKDGLFNTCKECKKEYNKKFYQENKEYHSEYMKKHYQENKEWYREYMKKHYQENKEYYANHSKKYHEENKEEIKERKRKYYQENKEYHSEFMKKHYQENKEWYREYAITYHLENPEVNRLNKQRRRARMAELPHDLTLEEWEETLEYFNNECAYCGDSESGLHQEHIIPVVKGGGYTADNIIPACQSCNSSKNATDLEEWYLSHKHYDEEKLNKVLDYVEIIKGDVNYDREEREGMV